MERLKSDLSAMIAHVKGLPGTPSPDQLLKKVEALSTAISRDASALPRRISEIVSEGFRGMGYDIHRHRVIKSAEFTAAGLVDALEEILQHVSVWSPPVEPTAEELRDLSKACDKLWDLDVNRMVPDHDYVLDLQRGKYSYEHGDFADEPLFSYVDEKQLERPTFAAFIALLDNYEAALGQSETVTREELAENEHFLSIIMDTAVMQYVHKYLLQTGKTRSTSREAFIRELNTLWFSLYSRKAHNDSSGFEHVFVGEVREDEITGFHNWIQLYMEEKKKRGFDYRGYIKPRRRGCKVDKPHSHEQLVTIQFSWEGATKNVSSSLIGVSPEFEIALYTLCFYSGAEENVVRIGPYRVMITCHRWEQRSHGGGKTVHIATSFPSQAPLDEDEAAKRLQSRERGRQQRSKNQRR